MKRNRRFGNANIWRIGALAAVASASIVLAGCGGGGGTSRSVSKVPTKATKDHLKSLYTQSFRALAQSGVNNSTLAAMSGAFGSGAATTVGTTNAAAGAAPTPSAPSDNSSHSVGPPVPQIGAFLNNVAAVKRSVRAASILSRKAGHRSLKARLTRDDSDTGSGSSGSSGGNSGVVDPVGPIAAAPSFYFDDYLGLWVDIQDTPTSSAYNLYEDEAKTKPAGSIVTTLPDFNTFPQVYSSKYSFTAGFEAGSHGDYESAVNADNSSKTTYVDVYTDGSSDQGSSSSTARGDYTWTGRTDYADKTYTSQRGTFRSDGSGAMHSEGSDGYKSDYTYRADGSGHASITGPDPGLPATIDWDVQGNTTIRYADGSSDFTPGWGYGDVVPVDTPVESGTTSSGVATTVAPATTTSKMARKAAH